MQFKQQNGSLALHHLLFEILVPGHLIVMSIYWTILHESVIQGCRNDFEVKAAYLNHSVPAFICLVNFLITDVIIKSSHSKCLLPFCMVYCWRNYIETKRSGVPVYFFMTWEDEQTIYIIGGIYVSTMLAYQALAYITYQIKRGDNPSVEKTNKI